MTILKFFTGFLAAILTGFLAAIFMRDGWFVPSSILFAATCGLTSYACSSLFPSAQ